MGDVIKSPTIIGLTGKLEGSYGAGGSLSTSTDGILLSESPKLAIAPGSDGSRSAPPGTTGYQRRAKPIGRTCTVPFKTEFKGAGVAYSTSVVPQPHVLWRVGGLDAAVTTTPGVEKWVYTPTPGPLGYGSGVFNAYAQGHLYPLSGVYCDWQMDGDDTGIVYVTANMSALLGAIADQITPPAIPYPLLNVVPPLSNGSTLFTIGNFNTANVRKWSFKMGRTITVRKISGGVVGFAVGRRTPQLDVTFETPTLATTPFHSSTAIDPYNLFDNASPLTVALQIGTTQYNRMLFSASGAQVMSYPTPDEDGDVVVTTLSLQLNPSAGNLNDEFSITTD